jgi:hypothetical protein
MKEVYVFFEKDDIKGVFDNFIKFRKNTFHYILGFLVKNGDFKSKLEGGKTMKKEFSKFYSKNSENLIHKDNIWKCKKFITNDLGEEPVEENKENPKAEKYESTFTKITVIKGTNNFKSLNNSLAYVKLSPLYER